MKYESLDKLLEETHKDLISIANSEFNLGVSTKFTKKQIAQLIMSEQRSGRVDSGPIEVLRGDRANSPEKEELPKGWCVMRLQKSKYNQSGYPVVIGLQGKITLLPVGISFRAPEWVIEHLNNALQQEIQKNPDQENEESVWVHSYPFTILKHNPSDNWHVVEDMIKNNMKSLGNAGF